MFREALRQITAMSDETGFSGDPNVDWNFLAHGRSPFEVFC